MRGVITESNQLLKYLEDHGVKGKGIFSDGAIVNPSDFPIAAFETTGTILFADLPGYSSKSEHLDPAECNCLVNHFFAWFEGVTRGYAGGIVDKFIGDEVMVVFFEDMCERPPFETALYVAGTMLENDPYGFNPRIGISCGPVAIGLVGTVKVSNVSVFGKTVNLASKYAGSTEEVSSIRIFAGHQDIARQIFKDANAWKVSPSKKLMIKDMETIVVVDILRKKKWTNHFDSLGHIKEMTNEARRMGVIIKAE